MNSDGGELTAFDSLWSMYLGRPTTLKTTDISPSCLSFVFDPTLSSKTSDHQEHMIIRIYESMLQLMERVGQLCDLRGPRPVRSADSCVRMASIGQQLRDWYTGLASDLLWTGDTRVDVPQSYYLLQ